MLDPTAQNLAVRQDAMSPTLGYAQALRAIGQALESLNIQNFEMKPVSDGYAVRGSYFASGQDLTPDGLCSSHVRAIWGSPNGWQPASNSQLQESDGDAALELQYTPEDIERLEQAGRAMRLDAHGMADASKLSQVL